MRKFYSIAKSGFRVFVYTFLMALSGLLMSEAGRGQATVTISCTGSSGSYNSGYVTSGGTENDGNLQVIGNGNLRRGWAAFDLSSIPTGSTINSVTLEFTVTSNNAQSYVNNEIHGFTGSPQSMAGNTLYNNCASGNNFNNSTWTQNATNSLTFNVNGQTFISNNLGSNVNIGFVRGNATSTYDIAGYPSSTNQPKLIINYTPPCTAPSITTQPISSTICAGTNTSFSISATGSNLTYQWQVSTNGGSSWTNVSNGGVYSNATAATLNITAATAGMNNYRYRCVVYSGVCNTNSNAATLTVNSVPPQPAEITGNTSLCAGATSVTYSVAAVSGATNYTWVVPSGWTINSGQGSNSINVTAGSNAGNVQVTPSNTCGNGTSRPLSVAVTSGVPSQPSTISGSTNICAGSIQTYSVTNVSGVTYTWSVPSDWAINSGQGTNSINVTAGSNGGSVQVTPSNSCGSGTVQSQTVTVNPLPTQYSVTGTGIYCSTTGGAVGLSNSQTGVNYQLYRGGTAIGSPVVGTGAALDFGLQTTAGTYTVTATNATTTCTNPMTGNAVITITTPPSATISYGGSPFCATGSASVTRNGTTGGSYSSTSGLSINASTGAINLGSSTPGTYTVTYTMAASGGCSVQTATTDITINPLPAAPTGATGAERCGNGSVTISVDDPGTGYTIDWYNAASNGTLVGTGTISYTTPSISSTTIYYAQTRNTATNCVSGSRTPVTATINLIPALPGTGGGNSICGPGAVTITASTANGITVDWYDAASGGNLLLSGSNTYTTSAISTTTTYYAEARNNTTGCVSSSRRAVTATINAIPTTPSGATGGTICGSGTANLSVAIPGSGLTIDWYDTETGGSVLPGGSGTRTFTTPTISTTTTYYAQTRISNTGCVSTTRTAVTATVNPLPAAPTGAVNGERCGAGTVSLSVADPGAGYTIDWYANSSGGAVLAGGSGTITYTTPSISSTTTYYAQTKSSTGCVSATRLPVTATVNPIPTKPTITASATSVCEGGVISFYSGVVSPVLSKTFSSTGGNASIPDYNNGGVSKSLNVSEIPSSAIIDKIEVTLNITEQYNEDLTINLQASRSGANNSKILNLVNRTATGSNFINTVFSTDAILSIGTSSPSYTGIFMPDGANNVNAGSANGGANSNVSSFAELINQLNDINGSWQINVRDNKRQGGNGTLSNWSMTIYYSTPDIEEPVIWSPAADLFTDIAGTAPYTGDSRAKVYLIPSTSGNKTYTATTTNGAGCSNSSDVTINAIAAPTGAITASKSTICVGESVTFTAPAGSAFTFYVDGAPVQGPSTSQTFSTSELTEGTHQITVNVANSNNCGALIGPVTVNVVALPTPTLTADKTTICIGDPVTFTATGGTSYTFRVNGSQVQTDTTGIWTTNSLANNDKVSVDVKNANGCIATSDTLTITVNALPTGELASDAGTPAVICAGSPITFTATAITGATYEFFVNGVSQGPASASNTFMSSAITNGQVVSVKVTNTSGCFANFNAIPVTVNPLPTGNFEVAESSGTANDKIICAGANVKFTAPAGYTNYKFYLNGTGTALYNGSSNVYNTNSLADGDFIKVVVTSSSNCSAEFTSPAITVNALPTGSLTVTENSGNAENDNAICIGAPITFTATEGGSGFTYAFVVDGSTQQTGASNVYTTSGLAAGTHNVSVTVTNNNGCVNTYGPVTVTVNALPTGTMTLSETSGVANNDGIICTGANVIFTAPTGFTNYIFLVNGFTVQSGTPNTYSNATLNNNDEVSVAVTNSNGCEVLLNKITITVNELPTVAAITGPDEVCAGSTITLADATSGGTWTSSNTGVATIDANTGVVTGVAAGTTTITYTVTNANECSQSVTKVITVNALPVLTAIAGIKDVCVGSTTALSSTPAGGVWTSDNTAIAAIDATTGVVTGVTEGSAVITYTVTNTSGCTQSVQATVNVHALPIVAAIEGDMKVCLNSMTILSNTASGGAWSSSNTTLATVSSTGIVTGKSVGTVTISYTVTNSYGCATTVTTDVVVNPLPQPTLMGKNPICVGETQTYVTQVGKSDYTWTVTGGTIVSGGTPADNQIEIEWTSSGAKSVYVNWTEPTTGCSAPTSVTITNGAISAPTLVSGPDVTCQNATDVFTTESGKNDYMWLINPLEGTITAGSGTNSITVSWLIPGNHNVTFNYAEPGGCNAASPTVHTVNVKPVPTATISGTTAVCENGTAPKITFTGANGTAPYTFTYSINGGASQTVTTVSGNSVTVDVPTGTLGTYIYALLHVTDKAPNSCGQDQSGTATITVNPLATGSISGTSAVCVNATQPQVTFTGGTGTAPFTFHYTINGGAVQTATTVLGNSISVNAPTNAAGTFIYALVDVSDANGCINPQNGSATITVNPLPTASVSASANEVCINGTSPVITFTGANGTAPYTFIYSINGVNQAPVVSSGNDATVNVPTGTTGTFVYALVSVQDNSSTTCTNTATGDQTVIVHPVSVGGTVSGGATVCAGSNNGTLKLSGQTGDVIRWEYSTDGGSTWTTEPNTTTTLTFSNITQTRQYRAVVQSGNCTSANSSPVTITVDAVSVGGAVGGSTAVCSGTNSGTVTLSANTGSVQYWEYSTNGGSTWNNISSTATSYTYSNLTATTLYRAIVKNGVCSLATSDNATITVNPLPTATISGSTSVCLNAAQPVITFTGANGTAPYTFSYRINGGAVQTVASTGNLATVNVPTSTVGTFTYTLVSVKDASSTGCSQNQTGSAVVTVNDLPQILGNITAAPASICLGGSSNLFIPTGTNTLISENFEGTNSFSVVNTTPHSLGSEWQVRNSGNLYDGMYFHSGSNQFALSISDGYSNTNTSLVSPPFNTVGYTSLNLSYRTYYRHPGYPETAVVEVSTNNGSTWTVVKSYTGEGRTVGSGSNFVSQMIDLSAYVNHSNVKVRFRYSVVNDWYWAIDDIKVTGTQSNDGNFSWTATPASTAGLPAGAGTPSAENANIVVTPTAAGNYTYTLTLTNANGCTASKNVTLVVNPLPEVNITADYCIDSNKVRLTASSTPSAGATYVWSTGETTHTIDVNVAGEYFVTVKLPTGCVATATIGVAQELVINGDFENGDDGSFNTLYTSHTGNFYNGNGSSGLWPEGYYAVDKSAFSPTSGVGYHTNFHGRDHTTGSGKFMMVNGSPDRRTIWSQEIDVLPNTTYYFSAWGMNLNPANTARLQFAVDTAEVGSIGELNGAPKPTDESQVNTNNWIQFYGNWTSGPTTTHVTISIVNLNLTRDGNDFGLDDISFGTLSSFIRLVSDPGTDAQVLCVNTPITPIVYLVGSTSANPTITPALPAGLTSSFDGQFLRITGTPTVAGTYSYTITTTATGNCGTSTATGAITVQHQTINLAAGSASPTLCKESPVNITFTLGGTATGATVTGLPDGVTGTVSGNTFTISGTPDAGATATTYPYTITTSGDCAPATFTGTITLEEQKITLHSGDDSQSGICINSPISNITYQLEGKATNASVSGLPAGVTYQVNSGFLIIQGTPSESGTFNYTVTSTGDCASATISGTIEITPAAKVSLTAGDATTTSCVNTSITGIEYTLTNATDATVTGLPAGMSGVVNSGKLVISGTPTVGGTFNYTVTTADGCDTASISGTIIVQEQTLELTDGSVSQAVCSNSAITDIKYTFGGTATTATVTGLPDGVTYEVVGNVITIHGAPTVGPGTYPYQVVTTGNCAVRTLNGTITVNPGPVGGGIASPIPPICGGSSSSITLSGQTGNIIRWESSTDGGTTWTNIANTTITQNYVGLTVPTLFRAVVGNTCDTVYSSVASVRIKNYWIGANSSDWNDGANWSEGIVPNTSCANVYVPSGMPHQPIISTGVSAITNLIIYPGAIVTVNGTGQLTIGGSITNNGTLDVTAGTIEFNGASQTVSGSVFKDKAVNNLIVSSGGTGLNVSNVLNDTLNITGKISFGNATADLNSGDNITLKSTYDKTASLGVVGANNTVTGDFTVERYINSGTAPGQHGKKWLFLATPTKGQTIKDSWMEGGNPVDGYGTNMTSPDGIAAGWDAYSPSPSLKDYNENTNLWKRAAAANATPLFNPKGWMVFVRGDRKVSGVNDPANTTILRSKGTLTTGNVQYNIPAEPMGATENWFFAIGNPYPAAIDMRKVPGISQYTIWYPDSSGEYSLGAYVTYAKDGDGNFVRTPLRGHNDYVNFIFSGEAFFLQRNPNPETLTITEGDKGDTTYNADFFRPMGVSGTEAGWSSLRSNVYRNDILLDGTLQLFDQNYSNRLDRDDARKMMNNGVNLSVKVDDRLLVVERRNWFNINDTIFYNLTGVGNGRYHFIFEPTSLAGHGLEAWLEDSYTKEYTPINLDGATEVNFEVTADAASKVANRFMMVFKTVPQPASFLKIEAVNDGNAVDVKWAVKQEINVEKYVVMYSTDGTNFTDLAEVDATGINEYMTVHRSPVDGYNYYRVRSIDIFGVPTYSDIAKVFVGSTEPSLRVFPNPVQNGVIQLRIKNYPAGKYMIRLLNPAGQLMLAKTFHHGGGNGTEKIPWDYRMAHGNYHLEVRHPDGSVKVILIMW